VAKVTRLRFDHGKKRSEEVAVIIASIVTQFVHEIDIRPCDELIAVLGIKYLGGFGVQLLVDAQESWLEADRQWPALGILATG
jgi:hypothetical protein